MPDKDVVSNSIEKIKIYAELMCNVTTGSVELNGNCVIRMGAEIIEALNIISNIIEKYAFQ